MLTTLLKLWWIETRRTFDWKRMGIFLYILFLLGCFVAGFYYGGGDALMAKMAKIHFENYAVAIVLSAIFPDFLMKRMLKQDAAVMDDFLKSKPVSQPVWNRFLLITNVLDYWNWMTPLVLTLLFMLLMPWYYVLLAVLMTVVVSVTNGVAITALSKAEDWAGRFAVWVGLLFYLFLLTPYALFFGSMGAVLHMMGMMGFAAVALWVVYGYLRSMHAYNESRSEASSVHGLGGGSLLSLEYVSLVRAKRLRQMVLMCGILFLLQPYLQAGAAQEVGPWLMAPYVYFAVAFPTLVLGQWVFGVEANFFHGLMTKPVRVEQLLRNKFYFYMLINTVMALLMLPGVWLGYWPWQMVLSTLLFSVISVLMMMPSCLYSSRLDVFSSAFFNYQGASWAINVYSLLAFVPMVIYILTYVFLPLDMASVALSVLGVGALGAHKAAIRWVSNKFMRRRYERMEKFNE